MTGGSRLATCVAGPLVALSLVGAPATAQPRSIDLLISNGALPADQQLVTVAQGDEVTLRLTSDKPAEVHLHGYDIEEKLSPGIAVAQRFTAQATGRFPIELHGERHGDERVIGYLEVRPR